MTVLSFTIIQLSLIPHLCDSNGSITVDHLDLLAKLKFPKPCHQRKVVTYRKFRSISLADFMNDLDSSAKLKLSDGSVNDLVNSYNVGIREIVDKHAPLKTKEITLRPNCPWYNETIHNGKLIRRRAERRWEQSKLEIHRQIYKQEVIAVNKLICIAKKDNFSEKIQDCGTDNKKPFQLSKKLMGKSDDVILPNCSSNTHLADEFDSFFIEKISTIRSNLQTAVETDSDLFKFDTKYEGFTMKDITSSNEEETREIITNASSKSSELDPLPTYLLKQCIDCLLPSITRLLNMSLSSSTVPDCFKSAIVRPLLKKPRNGQRNYEELLVSV